MKAKIHELFNFHRCCSHVGRKKGKQNLSLGLGCLRYGIVVHELGHAIGFWHEQNRPDRGSFIDILYNNVERGKSLNFDLRDEGEVKTFDQVIYFVLLFDLFSIVFEYQSESNKI